MNIMGGDELIEYMKGDEDTPKPTGLAAVIAGPQPSGNNSTGPYEDIETEMSQRKWWAESWCKLKTEQARGGSVPLNVDNPTGMAMEAWLYSDEMDSQFRQRFP